MIAAEKAPPAAAKKASNEEPKAGPTTTIASITWCGGGVLAHDGIEYPDGADIGHLPKAALDALPAYAVKRA